MKKGFSLIELLGVISILAVLTIIGTVSINSLIQKGKNDTYEIIKKSATTSLKLWGSDNLLYMPEENEVIYMTLYQLKLLGYVKDLKNPKTNNYISNNSILTITNNNGYQYNIVIDDNEETSNDNLPTLSFDGDIVEKIELNSQYTLPSSNGIDSNGNDISSSITTSVKKVVDNELVNVDSINANSGGIYLIYYTYNNVSIIKNVIVYDNIVFFR